MSRLIELEDELTQILYKYNVLHRALSEEREKIALDHKGLAEQTQKLTLLVEGHEKFLAEFNEGFKENLTSVLSYVAKSMQSIASDVSSEQIKAVVNPLEVAVDNAQSKINRLTWNDKTLFWERLGITIGSSVFCCFLIMAVSLVVFRPIVLNSFEKFRSYEMGHKFKVYYDGLTPAQQNDVWVLLDKSVKEAPLKESGQ